MGLTAVVYRSIANTRKEFAESESESIESSRPTSENANQKFPTDNQVASRKRLGNLNEISFLRARIEQVIGTKSLIVSKVLYSASHAGDTIGSDDFVRLRSEIEKLEQQSDARLEYFLESMKALIVAGESEGNPITFV